MSMPESRTIPALLAEQAVRYENLEALVEGEQRYTYAALWRKVREFAKGLMELGVKKGSHVAILMGNKPEWIIADLAICSIGATMVSVNTWVTARELAYILRHSDTDTLIFTDRFLKYDYVAMLSELEPHADALPALSRLIHLGEQGFRDSIPFAEVYERGQSTEDAALQSLIVQVEPTDIAYLLYTSGSTSTPKGVQLQHFGLIENMWSIGNRMHVLPGDRAWFVVSLYWGLGCVNILFNMLTHGGCIVLQEHFDAGEALRLIEQERCTIFYGTTNMAQALVDHPARHEHNLSSLRSGGSLGSPDQMQRLADLGPREICHLYGLTESYGNSHVSDGRLDPRDKVFTSVGRPLEGMIQRIVDPESAEIRKPGDVGELQLKGYITLGYYKDEDKNREAFTQDGFFRTGDLGYVDEEGFFYFRGRLKEMIKTGGINVAPAEVESILIQQEGVRAAYVVGVPDAARGEVVAAIVVTDNGDRADLRDRLMGALKKELAAYKLPKLFRFVNEQDLPLTSTGKIHKNRLAQLFANSTSEYVVR